jgi:putative sigma-54 modulation protein
MIENLKKGKRSRIEARTARRKARAAAAPQTAIDVTFRHVEPTPALHRYAERKLAHMSRYANRSCRAHVILTVDKYRQYGEVTVKSGRLTLTAQEETKDLYSVIDLLAANVERQLKKHLEKIKARKTRAISAAEALLDSEAMVANEK